MAREEEYPSRSESRHHQDTSDWHLDPYLFLALMKIRGPCQIDLFANRLNAQLPAFFSSKPNPQGLPFNRHGTQGGIMPFPHFVWSWKLLPSYERRVATSFWLPRFLANTTLVHSTTTYVDSPTSASSSGSQAFDQPSGGPPPASSTVSSRMACIQQSVSTRGISDRAYKLILAS